MNTDSTSAADGFVPVACLSEIPTGRGLTVRVTDREIALFQVDGQVYALDARCPHREGPLGEGVTENGRVYCPLHGWEFDVRDGSCFTNPEKSVRCYAVRVSGQEVQIQIPSLTQL